LGLAALTGNEGEPREIAKWLDSIYRFCDSSKEVNWNARRKIDSNYYEDFVVPAMYRFVEENLKRVTFSEDALKGIIGLSGGLDSVVAAYVAVGSMQKAVVSGRVKESSLVLANFSGLEERDTRTIARDLAERHDEVNIRYIELDIFGLRGHVGKIIKKAVRKIGVDFLNVPGEITTRMICSLVNEIGTRAGYASIDSTNGTEFVLGEFTVGLGYDVVLLSDLYKSSVFKIGEILRVPEPVLTAQPRNTAYGTRSKVDLYFGGVPDGVSPRQAYEVLDPVLYWLYERKKSPEKIASVLGHDVEFVRNVKRRIDNQGYRRIQPHFCVEDHEIKFEGSLACGGEESKRVIEESMLRDLFGK
jgi:NH3-dependent NAD+ synthetase